MLGMDRLLGVPTDILPHQPRSRCLRGAQALTLTLTLTLALTLTLPLTEIEVRISSELKPAAI